MNIKTNYYYRGKDGVLREGGKIVFNRYRILSVDGREISEKGITYYSSPVDDILKIENGPNLTKSVSINRIITEKEYTSNQMEYYIWLSWTNEQKFKWINKRHFLQLKKNLLHLGLILLFIYFVYQLIQNLTD
ncbi:MAG: hypothetical protein RL516_123 [Bacteroidota bacterium]|jgi:hypothetical protein